MRDVGKYDDDDEEPGSEDLDFKVRDILEAGDNDDLITQNPDKFLALGQASRQFKTTFDSYVDAGFTENQALKLIAFFMWIAGQGGKVE